MNCNNTRSFSVPSRIPDQVYTVFNGHTAAVNRVQWHPIYGHLLASSSLDKTVKIWSVYPRKGEVLSIAHKEAVKDVRWNCDARHLYSGGLDDYVNVIDVETGKCIHSYKHTEYRLMIVDNEMGNLFMPSSYTAFCISIRR